MTYIKRMCDKYQMCMCDIYQEGVATDLGERKILSDQTLLLLVELKHVLGHTSVLSELHAVHAHSDHVSKGQTWVIKKRGCYEWVVLELML